MSDGDARAIHERARLGRRLTWGSRPAVLVVDLSLGFTDPRYALGADLTPVVAATRRVLDAARKKRLPVVFTTIGYEAHLSDAGIWPQKAPALAELILGERLVEIDPRVEPVEGEPVLVKKGSSAFFGTNLAALLVARGIDTVVLCGASTSGCIRATAVDLLQHGFPAVVPREAVGDRAARPHEANLFDIDEKYGDVVPLDAVLAYLASVAAR